MISGSQSHRACMGFSTLPPVTIREFLLALQDERAAMPQQLIDNLILSMGRRCETCLAVGRYYPLLKTRCFLLDTHHRDFSAFSRIALHATFSIKLLILFIPLISLLGPEYGTNLFIALRFSAESAFLNAIFRYQIVACLVLSLSPVPLKNRRVGQRCTLNLSRAETSSRWCGVVVKRGGANSGVVHVTLPWFKITSSVTKRPRVPEECDVNIQSISEYLEQ
ncbi:uncharacterized protein TNCV_3557021 [Trichonephila clavipes]|uniref:Uncharacterized protein n=1 Tax=Trichonephila clavipes TaxID=2585209 RepID=A0A8X7BJ02_TRICX|nr:uncharacterized protein TNCV_3557021 [Trichonephila clavipes]